METWSYRIFGAYAAFWFMLMIAFGLSSDHGLGWNERLAWVPAFLLTIVWIVGRRYILRKSVFRGIAVLLHAVVIGQLMFEFYKQYNESGGYIVRASRPFFVGGTIILLIGFFRYMGPIPKTGQGPPPFLKGR